MRRRRGRQHNPAHPCFGDLPSWPARASLDIQDDVWTVILTAGGCIEDGNLALFRRVLDIAAGTETCRELQLDEIDADPQIAERVTGQTTTRPTEQTHRGHSRPRSAATGRAGSEPRVVDCPRAGTVWHRLRASPPLRRGVARGEASGRRRRKVRVGPGIALTHLRMVAP